MSVHESGGVLGGTIGLIIVFFIIILSILWIIMPFYIVGISNKLDKLNRNLIKIGKLLKEKDSKSRSVNGGEDKTEEFK